MKHERTNGRMVFALNSAREYLIITFAILVMAVGIHFFKFPNQYTFGGVSGLAVLLAEILPLSATTATTLFNLVLMVVGIVFVGRGFGIRTVYATVCLTVMLEVLERVLPMNAPLTGDSTLELIFAISLPAISSAILFYVGASSGGTDVLAMLMKKYTGLDIGYALIVCDLIVCVASFFILGVTTGLYTLCGIIAKSFLIDRLLDEIRLRKCFTIFCDNPEEISAFVNDKLNRSTTCYSAVGMHSHHAKTVIICVVSPQEARVLEQYIKTHHIDVFYYVTKSNEVIGRGYRDI